MENKSEREYGLPYDSCPGYDPETDSCYLGWFVMLFCKDHGKCPKTVYRLKETKRRKDGLVELHWEYKQEMYK